MTRRAARIGIAAALTALVVPGGLVPSGPAPGAEPKGDLAAGIARQLAAGIQVVPKQAAGAKAQPTTANPYLALLPDATQVDKSYWDQVVEAKSAERAGARQRAALSNRATASAAAATPPLLHDEAEPAGIFGSNDTHATAELVKGFGTGRRLNNKSRILGQISPDPVTITTLTPFAEDNGSIPLASDPGVSATRRGARTNGTIGDGPHGSAGTDSGDFDFYRVTATAGQVLIADTDLPATPTPALDSVVVLYDDEGVVIASDDDSGEGLSSLLQFPFTETGTYYLMVAGFGGGTIFPADPFDSGSGLGTGSEGPYSIALTVSTPDRDYFAVDLVAGDTIGSTVTGVGTELIIRDETGRVVLGSEQDASSLYPPNAPLPGGGNAVATNVAARPGRYSVEVVGTAGRYDITLEAYRPGAEATPQGTTQTLFLDFDGARVNTAIWGGPGVRQLSPLAGFLGRWGLTAADEDRVIDQTIRAVRENIIADSRDHGTDPRFGLQILNSRDHADPVGQPNVHRIIVGGTIAESGINTIGIAQFIDPGNFALEDNALVLLDILSSPPASSTASLNRYITPESNKIGFIGRALGNVIAHEGGHLYGSYHTDTFNEVQNLMDAGGNFPGMFGVGPDRIGGTADDDDYDFGEDTLYPSEGFIGTEDTLNTTAWGLTKGKA
jgi:Bacterial pre-peptidase C-terminal domain